MSFEESNTGSILSDANQFRNQVSSDREVENSNVSLALLLLEDTNKLLSAVGIGGKQVMSYNELCRVGSSLFVAVFEALFNCRIEGINRNPRSQTDYINNAQLVIDALSERVRMNLDHITGRSIVVGDYRALSDLVNLLLRIVESMTEFSPHSSIETRESIRNVVGPPSTTLRSRSHSNPNGPSSPTNSISTHPSDFGDGFRADSPSDSIDKDRSRTSSTDHSSAIMQAQQALQSKHKFLTQQQHKQQAAGHRRARQQLLSEISRREKNMRVALRSHRMRNERHIADRVKETQSFCMRRSSQEQALLRRVHKGVISQLVGLKIDGEEEEKLRLRAQREQSDWYAQALSQLLSNNMDIYREKANEALQRDRDSYRESIRRTSEMIRYVKEKDAALLDKQRSRLLQTREHELIRRHELFKSMASLVAAETWEDTLRLHPASTTKNRSRSRSRSSLSSKRGASGGMVAQSFSSFSSPLRKMEGRPRRSRSIS